MLNHPHDEMCAEVRRLKRRQPGVLNCGSLFGSYHLDRTDGRTQLGTLLVPDTTGIADPQSQQRLLSHQSRVTI